MITGPTVIFTLKVLVAGVTLLLMASLVALWRGRIRLHGRINLIFFVLTTLTLIAFEGLIRVIQPELTVWFESHERVRKPLMVHLCFSVPSALLMPVMLYTGLKHKRKAHLALAVVFAILWTGTVITGIFFLPHS